MKNLWNKVRNYLAGLSVVMGVALTLAFLFGKNGAENVLSNDDNLADEGDNIDKDINSLESELDVPVDDLTDQQVEDYWN